MKATWSEALAGFANTQGGVLIWGVDARKDTTSSIDAACGVSFVKNPLAFKSRLMELHRQATEPPVHGVEIEAYSISGSPNEGFVVCLIPESPFKPHRAEYAGHQYIIRAGDNFAPASVSLLRNLFFPQSRCLLVPKLKSRSRPIPGRIIDGFLTNTGSATAFDTFVIIHSDPKGATCRINGWEMSCLVPYKAHAKKPIHPGVTSHFFTTQHGQQKDHIFKIQIFAQDAEPALWTVSFTDDELKACAEKTGERGS